MSDNLITAVVSIALAIVGVATLSVILSKNANTAGVIGAGGNALALDLAAATAPITGQAPSLSSSSIS